MKNIKWILLASLITLGLCITGCGSNNENGITQQNEYYKNGKLLSTTPHVKGVAHGVKLEYYDTGALRKEVPYENGVVNGLVKTYYPEGTIYSTTPRVFGKIEGAVKKYHKNGKLLSETPYINNELQLGLKEFDNKGRPRDSYKIEFSEKTTKHGSGINTVLEMKITPAIRSAKFFQIVDSTEMGNVVVAIPMNQKNGQLTLSLPAGASIETIIKVKSEFVTRYHNRGVAFGEYYLKKSANP
jgi:hypothetical protein